MSGSTSVPTPTFGDNGFVAPNEQDILSGLQDDIGAAFGGGLNPALETPQGQLASSLAAIIGDAYAQFVWITQNIDPAYSSGRMQDALGRIYGLVRNPALPTTVTATCVGLSGTVIPVGALALAQDGNKYVCVDGGVISNEGTVDLQFVCTTTGPIPCPAGTLDQIYQTVVGWDSVSNVDDGVIGSDLETRAAFELRRQETLQSNSAGANSSILGAVLSVENVLDAYVIDNPTGSSVVVDGVTIPAHGVYVCASGGDTTSVATAAWSKKPPGTPWANANTTVVVTDNNPLYATPPSYTVKYQVPTPQSIYFLVTMSNLSLIPSNATTQIQDAVVAAFSGADGGSRARIKSTVYASRYYPGIEALGPWANIVSVKIGSDVEPSASFVASISGTVMTVTTLVSGTIAIGQFVKGVGVADGVYITALGTGGGGTGTYILNLPQAVGSESMVSVLPTLDRISIGEAHVPVLAPANVKVVTA